MISAFRPESPDADWESIRVAMMTRLSAAPAPAWTDHNAVDPGITLLEVLAYGLADLHYRTGGRDLSTWPMEVTGWLPAPERAWHVTLPLGSVTALADALAADAGGGVNRAAVLEPLVRAAGSRDEARTLLATPPWPAAFPGTPADLVIDLMRARLVRQVATERTGLIDDAVRVARAQGGTTAQSDARAAAALAGDLPLWTDELTRLVTRHRRRISAETVVERAADVIASDTVTALTAVRSLLTNSGDLTVDEATAAIAVHPDPPGERPETWETVAGESRIWPPHPLQALTCEPVTADDYARLARGVTGVHRAWAVAGQLPGVAWDGAVVTTGADRPGTVTLVVEAVAPPADETVFLREVLRKSIGSEVDQPHPTWQDTLDPLDPRRMICDEVGATLLKQCPVVVQGTLVAAVGTIRSLLIDAALVNIATFFEHGRPESRLQQTPETTVSGPWPRIEQPADGWQPGEAIRFTELVQVILADPEVLGVEDLSLVISGGTPVPASAGIAAIGPACVPVLADDQCLRVELSLTTGCGDA